MSENNNDGMKRCTKCGEWKPATAEFFNRDKTKKGGLRTQCRECQRKYRQKNKDKIAEWQREYYEKNKDKRREYYEKNKERVAEWKREYREKNKRKVSERDRRYQLSPAGRLSGALGYIREKTGATIYLRDMTNEEKETLANQYIAVKTLEKTEKELLAVSGKKR